MLFIAVAFIEFLAGMEVDIFILSYPELQQQFGLSPAKVQLCLSLNFITYCIGSLYDGPLGDRYGLRRVILTGLVIFIIGSVACSFAADFSYILLGRILQGLGMAAPACLGYVVIAERYPIERQAAMFGTLNGFTNIAVAIAPVIGSYIALYAGWRGNFAALLVLALIAMGFCLFVIPYDSRENKDISLSLKAYKPFLESKTFKNYLIVLCVYNFTYWVFIGMGSILYVEGFGVSLASFGYYQGAVAGSFALMSLLSPKLLSKFGHQKCFKVAIILITIFASLIGLVAVLDIRSPLLITTLMCFLTMSTVFPVNILYPLLLDIVPNAKSRAASVNNVARLIGSAICIESASYAYNGTFLQIGLLIFGLSIVGLIFAKSVSYWGNKNSEHVA
jgi:DHA1 family bicyclomycin/chloramphenicol resistance-like MFS transporter